VKEFSARRTAARLLPFTGNCLICLWPSSTLAVAPNQYHLAKWSLGMGIAAAIGANLAHGMSHGPIGAGVSAWPGARARRCV
jgi:hypothetical protein